MTTGTGTGWGDDVGTPLAFPAEDATPSPWPDDDVDTDVVPGRAQRRRRRPVWAGPVAVILAVTAIAGGMRFYHLSTPGTYVFDEVYYAKDGCYDAGFPYKQCHLDAPGEQTITVHPPVGRWMVAAGEKLFGNTPFGWRVASATAGTLSVAMFALLVYLLWGSTLWAGLGDCSWPPSR